MDWLGAHPFAHRGLHGQTKGVVENSRSAFALAIEHGFGIELDVQLSRDGHAMVFHDRGLSRLTNETGAVRRRTAAELGQIKLKNSEDVIEPLANILDLVDGRVPVLVEIKTRPRESAGALEAAVADVLDRYTGPVAVMSFAPSSVAWFAAYAPHIPRGIVAMDFVNHNEGLSWAERQSLTHLTHWDATAPDFIAYNCNDLPQNSVAAIRRQGVPVFSWTVRSAETRARIHPFVDQIIFEGFMPNS